MPEVPSIICMKRTGAVLGDAWVAHGTKVSLSHTLSRELHGEISQISKFQLDSDAVIQDLSHALVTIEVGEHPASADALNEVRLHFYTPKILGVQSRLACSQFDYDPFGLYA